MGWAEVGWARARAHSHSTHCTISRPHIHTHVKHTLHLGRVHTHTAHIAPCTHAFTHGTLHRARAYGTHGAHTHHTQHTRHTRDTRYTTHPIGDTRCCRCCGGIRRLRTRRGGAKTRRADWPRPLYKCGRWIRQRIGSRRLIYERRGVVASRSVR